MNDNFIQSKNHIENLYKFLTTGKDEQFISYITSLTKDDMDINMRIKGNYLIFLAVIYNKKNIVRILLEKGSRIDNLDDTGKSILYYIINNDFTELFNIIIEHSKNEVGVNIVDIVDRDELVPIMYAINNGNHYFIQELINHGANVNYKNKKNISVLHYACKKKDPIIVRMIIGSIKDINVKILTNGRTPLLYACIQESNEIVKILLDNGADPNIPENMGDLTPIFYSAAYNKIEITEMLLNKGVNINHQESEGNTLLHVCFKYNRPQIMEMIFDKYDILKKTKSNNENIVQHSENNVGNLIDPNIINVDGMSILNLILSEYDDYYEPFVRKLLPYVNLNYQDNNGNTYVTYLLKTNLFFKFDNIIRKKKMDIFIKNIEGVRPIDLIPLTQFENVMNIVIDGYYNYLLDHPNDWNEDWQLKCSNLLNEMDICKQIIKKHIQETQTSVPIRKSKKDINLHMDEKVRFTTFTGSLLDMFIGYKYLVNKFKDCYLIIDKSNEKYTKHHNNDKEIENEKVMKIADIEILWINQRLFFPHIFLDKLEEIYKSNKFSYIIVPVAIILDNGNHANVMLIDLKNKTIERFEPHGSEYPYQFNYNPELLDSLLEKKLFMVLADNFKYYKPKSYLPKIGFQSFDSMESKQQKNIGDPDGFCILWCIWYAEYRLANRDINKKTLVKKIIRKVKTSTVTFRERIRNYSKRITDIRDKILEEEGFDINDFLNSNIPEDKFNIIRDKLINY